MAGAHDKLFAFETLGLQSGLWSLSMSSKCQCHAISTGFLLVNGRQDSPDKSCVNVNDFVFNISIYDKVIQQF